MCIILPKGKHFLERNLQTLIDVVSYEFGILTVQAQQIFVVAFCILANRKPPLKLYQFSLSKQHTMRVSGTPCSKGPSQLYVLETSHKLYEENMNEVTIYMNLFNNALIQQYFIHMMESIKQLFVDRKSTPQDKEHGFLRSHKTRLQSYFSFYLLDQSKSWQPTKLQFLSGKKKADNSDSLIELL